MKKENLVAWSILTSLRRENDERENKKIWQKIFRKCRNELTELESGKIFTHYHEVEITEDDMELGLMRITRMVMEHYNKVMAKVVKRMENRMTNTNNFLKRKRESGQIKKETVSLVISNMLKKIKEDQALQATLKKELSEVMYQIRSFEKVEVA